MPCKNAKEFIETDLGGVVLVAAHSLLLWGAVWWCL